MIAQAGWEMFPVVIVHSWYICRFCIDNGAMIAQTGWEMFPVVIVHSWYICRFCIDNSAT